MHMAMSAIKLGDIDQALIIGGNVIAQPVHNVMFSKTGILSPTGSSKSFDAAADGYARYIYLRSGFQATNSKSPFDFKG